MLLLAVRRRDLIVGHWRRFTDCESRRIGPMVRITHVVALLMVFGCNVTDNERCSEGRVWSPQFNGCIDAVGGASGGTSAAGGKTVEGGASEGGASQASGTSDTTNNLGAACTKDDDCSGGIATFCLLSPSAPTDPGMCTISNCNAAACGTQLDCCDCSASPILKTVWPKPVCVPTSNVAAVTGIGCSCT